MLTGTPLRTALVALALTTACNSDAPPSSEPATASATASTAEATPEAAATTSVVDEAPAPDRAPTESAELPAEPPPATSATPAQAATTAKNTPAATPATEPATEPEPEQSVGYAGDDPCTTKKFKFSAVKAACARGGRKEVKSLMKATAKKAAEGGTKFKCKNCHSNMKTFALKDNAVTDLKPWL